jgi:hypothetical protein
MEEKLSPVPKDLPQQSFGEFIDADREVFRKSHRFDTMIPITSKKNDKYSYVLFDVGLGNFVLEHGCIENKGFIRRGRFYFKNGDDHILSNAEVVFFEKDQEREYNLAYYRYGKKPQTLSVNIRNRNLNIPIALVSYNGNSILAENIYLAAENPDEVKRFYTQESTEKGKIATHPPGAEINLTEGNFNPFLFVYPGNGGAAGIMHQGEVFKSNLVTNPYSYQFEKISGATWFYRINEITKKRIVLRAPNVDSSDLDFKMRHSFENCKTIDKTYRPQILDQ